MAKQDEKSHEETRERILSAAEELFAEKGFEASSVRDITSRAQCNIASVNYYFGNKEKLYGETAHRLLSDLREHQISQLRRKLDQIPGADLEDFLRSFARGFIDPLKDDSRSHLFLLFFAREMLDPHLPPKLFFGEFIGPLMAFTTPVLMKLAPPLNRHQAILCIMSIVGQLHHRLKTRGFIPKGVPAIPALDSDSYLEHIVQFSAAGIRACASSGETT